MWKGEYHLHSMTSCLYEVTKSSVTASWVVSPTLEALTGQARPATEVHERHSPEDRSSSGNQQRPHVSHLLAAECLT